MRKLVVFGDRQIAEVCAFYFEHDSDYELVAFTVDGAFLQQDRLGGKPVVPFEELGDRFPAADHDVFVAMSYAGMNKLRAAKTLAVEAAGYTLARYVSTKAYTWPGLAVGKNSFVMEANVIQPFAAIGDDTILWSGNHIGHHSRIGDHCFIASHVVISGNVEIGDHCFLGVNATIRDGVKVAPRCLVGAGALITRDTAPDQVFPAPFTEASRVPSSRVSP
jgi:sugar O-acyltransferase (sialic acid O-acetyltransferase NeuD family)